jgi:ABC-type amino acid transport substrate-binding protein
MMQRSILAGLLALALLVPAAGASAQGSAVLGRIVKDQKLRVGLSGSQPPLNFKSKDGTLMGLEVDLARGLAATMGVEVEFVQKPFGDLLDAVAKGEVDLVMSGMSITPERNMRVAFVGPYHLSGKSLLTKSSTLAQAQEADDLDDIQLKVSALRGSTSEKFVDAVLPKAELLAAETWDEAVKAVVDDKVQAMVADFEACVLAVLLNPRANLTMSQRPLTVEPIGIAVAPGDALLVNFLENTLGALQTTGLLDALRTRWLDNGDWVEQLP